MNEQTANSQTKWLRYSARAIALAWAGFWLFFGAASGVGEGLRLTGMMMHIMLPGVLFLGVALLAWRWEIHGAIVFLAIGIIILVAYPVMAGGRFPLATVMFVHLTMALPPLLAGVLLFFAARKEQQRGLSPLDDGG